MKPIDILYLCDNMACLNSCNNSDCTHTSNLEHAIHKDSLDGRLFEYIDTGDRIGFFESEPEITTLNVDDDIREAIDYLEKSLDEGYVDVSDLHEKREIEILKEALQLYKFRYSIKW